MAGNYKVDVDRIAPFIRRFLKAAVEKAALKQTKATGAAGSFKLGEQPKPKKEKVAKKPKAVAKKPKTPKKAAKKPAAKKAVKKTPKKAAKKPKAASAKKPAAKPKKTVAKKPKAAAKKSPKKAAKAKKPAKKWASCLHQWIFIHIHPKAAYQGHPNPPKRAFTWHAIVYW